MKIDDGPFAFGDPGKAARFAADEIARLRLGDQRDRRADICSPRPGAERRLGAADPALDPLIALIDERTIIHGFAADIEMMGHRAPVRQQRRAVLPQAQHVGGFLHPVGRISRIGEADQRGVRVVPRTAGIDSVGSSLERGGFRQSQLLGRLALHAGIANQEAVEDLPSATPRMHRVSKPRP